MEKVLLTGAAGFIGAYTARELVKQGFYVIGIDNLNDYYDPKLKEHRLELLSALENFEFEKIDIEDREGLKKVFDKHDIKAVINLAARAGVRYSMEHPHLYMNTNAVGTLNLLEEIRERGIKKLVLASTSSLYAGQEMPFLESLAVNTPISPYAASKKAAEVMAYSYHYLYGIDVSVVRYFTVYGPAGRPDMCIYRFIKWINEGTPITLFGNGSQARDFTFVEDIAKGTVCALKEVGYEIFNLGGGKNPISLNEIIKKIEVSLDKKCERDLKPFHKADINETWADISKAKDILGWEPTVSIDDGLKESIDWYKTNIDFLNTIELPE